MYKFLYLWLLWLILLPLCTLIHSGGAIESEMLLLYDSADTSLWEIHPDNSELSLWLDFDALSGSIIPLAFRVDRQSIIYLRLPYAVGQSKSSFELVEFDIQSGLELSIVQSQTIYVYAMPTRDRILVQMFDGGGTNYCVFTFVTGVCSSVSEELLEFLISDTIVWQDNSGYVLTDTALYQFDDETMTWIVLLEDAWLRVYSAAYDAASNSLLIAGNRELPETTRRSVELIRVNLSNLLVETLPFELPSTILSFARMYISPNGRYLHYDTAEINIIDLETGESVYQPFILQWRSDQALWLDDSQRLIFAYYEELNTGANRIAEANIATKEVELIYEGTVGYVRLYQVP